MDGFFSWLSSNPTASTAFIVLLAVVGSSVSTIYLVAFFQEREISFWPPKIGRRPENKKSGPITSIKASQEDLKRLFDLDGDIILTRSEVKDDGKRYVRDPDSRLTGQIAALTRGQILYEDPLFSMDRPTSHLIVIGSPRYNPYAEYVQKYFDLPYDYIFSSYATHPKNRILKIITCYGDELTSSQDHRGDTSNIEVDYGILFCGNLSNGKRVIWIGGIHGVGTIGVYRFLVENASNIKSAFGDKVDSGTSWLLRIRYDKSEGDHSKAIKDIEVMGKPAECGKKHLIRMPKVLLFDLGNVILHFDRTRTYRAIAHFLNVSFEDIQQRIENTDLRQRYEKGLLTDPEFLDELSSVIGDKDHKIEQSILAEFWADIFWPNQEMFHALKSLEQQNIVLVLLSNTNSLHFQNVKRDYPDIIELFDELILSYKENRVKPDQGLFSKAITVALDKCKDGSLEDIIFVDDKAEYVKTARSMGVDGFTFRSYPHFIYWLRQKGLHVA